MHRLRTWQLLAICVLTWGTTWHVITYQIGHTPPEVGVALRFGLAAVLVLGWCTWRGVPLRFSLTDHARFAVQGGFMYGVSYVCVYHAEQHVASGLVAVGYSASPLISGVGALLLFGVAVTQRFVWGGLLAMAGVALIFWPEFGKEFGPGAQGSGTGLGVAFTVASVVLSTIGSLSASRNRTHRLPFWPALGFGMLYGAAAAALIAWVQGQSFAVPAVASWWVALLYLALFGSVLTFACFLTLQERIGPGPAGSVGALTPLLALAMSITFEGYAPDALTAAGAALAVLGNALMLGRASTRAGTLKPAAAAAE